jgi:hypothetical protein
MAESATAPGSGRRNLGTRHRKAERRHHPDPALQAEQLQDQEMPHGAGGIGPSVDISTRPQATTHCPLTERAGDSRQSSGIRSSPWPSHYERQPDRIGQTP